MDILETLIQLRDDIKTWVTNNLNALNAKIESKTIPIDNELKTDSTNPVQNKIIKAKTDELANAISALDNIIGTIQNNIDNITDDGSGEFNIADPNGNVIFKVNKDGIHTTNINTNGDNFTISDANGNIIFKVDAEGAHTTDVTVDGISIKVKMPEWDAKSNFSGDYNDLINAPNITDDGSDEYIIVDESGNIIFKVDAAGAHTTEVNLSGTNVKDTLESLAGDIEDIETVKIPDLNAELVAHKADTNNPHEVAFKQLKDSNIIDDESGEVVYADSNGNIISRIDSNGIETTKVSANEVNIKNQTVIGKYNVIDTTSAFIIGNGSNNENRSNAYSVDQDGNSIQSGVAQLQGIIMSSYYDSKLPENYFNSIGTTPQEGQIYIQLL